MGHEETPHTVWVITVLQWSLWKEIHVHLGRCLKSITALRQYKQDKEAQNVSSKFTKLLGIFIILQLFSHMPRMHHWAAIKSQSVNCLTQSNDQR